MKKRNKGWRRIIVYLFAIEIVTASALTFSAIEESDAERDKAFSIIKKAEGEVVTQLAH